MSRKRRLGATDIETVPLAFGGNVFGWTADKATSFRLLDAFVERGGSMIDTADIYSAWVDGNKGGESESIIGDWLRQSGKRDRIVLVTKVGMLAGAGGDKLAPARIATACEDSLRRLATDRIDVYFAHQDDEDTPQDAVLEAFDRLIKAGKVRVIGASNFHAARLKSALDLAHQRGLPHYHVLQPEYNLVSRHRFEGELQDLCVERNIAVTPYYGLAGGFLTGKYRSAGDLGKSVRGGRHMGKLIDSKRAVLAAMDEVAAETGASLAQIALAWLAAQPGVAAPIASATSLAQLDDIMGSVDLALSPAQLDRLTAAGA